MATECYAMVRGSSLRITDLLACGAVPDPVYYATAKCVSEVRINEVTESGENQLIRTEDDEPRLHFLRSEQTIRYTVDIDFLRVDPGVLALVAGVHLAQNGPNLGFGEGPFGEGPFGGPTPTGPVTGFDSKTRLPAKAFALEVWSRLADNACADGERKYGYTLFPYLKGGVLSGFTFANGLVSFNLRGAQTRRGSKWGYGPWDLTGPWERLDTPVSGNTSWRTFVTTAPPPVEQDGIQSFEDVVDDGFSDDVGTDTIDDGYSDTVSLTTIDDGSSGT